VGEGGGFSRGGAEDPGFPASEGSGCSSEFSYLLGLNAFWEREEPEEAQGAVREAGSFGRGLRPDPKPKESRALRFGQAIDPALEEWSLPDRSAKAERGSLLFQAGRVHAVEEPSEGLQLCLEDWLVERYPAEAFDPFEDLHRRALLAVDSLKLDASPGMPFMQVAPTNAKLLQFFGREWLASLVVERMLKIQAAPVEAFESWSAIELVRAGLVDPVRVFVKNELHDRLKVSQKRYRLICSVSVVDQCVERILCSRQNNAEIDSWTKLFSKPGLGLNDDGLEELESYFRSMKKPTGSDISGFDWSVPQWLLDVDARVRSRLAGGGDMWIRRARLLGLSLFVLSDGTVFEQVLRGIQKSGSYNTSSTNSRIRVALAALVSDFEVGSVAAMGDDCVEDTSWLGGPFAPSLMEAYAKYGFKLKEVQFAENEGFVEFCAYRFWLDGGEIQHRWEPVRADKMIGTFLATWPQEAQFDMRLVALEHELRHYSRATGAVADVLEVRLRLRQEEAEKSR